MTDESVQQIFAFARDAFAGGQKEIILEALPFRMTPEKMAIFSAHKDFKFWTMLREGYDAFELTKFRQQLISAKRSLFSTGLPKAVQFNVNAACPPSQPRFPQLTPVLASYDAKFQSSFAAASKKFEGVPFPVVMGGKSRPLDKKWKPQPVKSGPSANALIVEAERAAAKAKAKAEADAAEVAAATPADATQPEETAASPAAIASAPAANAEHQRPSEAPVSAAATPATDPRTGQCRGKNNTAHRRTGEAGRNHQSCRRFCHSCAYTQSECRCG